MEGKGDLSSEETPEMIKPTRKAFIKTQGFGRTTVAKRESVGDVEAGSQGQQPPRQHSLALGRSGTWPQCIEPVEESLTIVQRRRRKNAHVSFEDSSEPTSCPVLDVETALEGSVGSASEMKSGPHSGSLSVQERASFSGKATGSKEKEDTSDNDSDGLTLKELQNRLWRKREQEPPDRPLKGIQNHLRKKRREENPTDTVHDEAGTTVKNALPSKQEPETVQRVVSQAVTHDQESQRERTAAQQVKDEESRDSGKPKPECELHDLSTLDRMCLQPCNNRFMSCCDRCEERFRGDCGGASQARGRLLERNREDYICPNCTVLQVQDETKAETTDHRETKFRPGDADDTEFTSTGTVEQKSSEDQKVKRRVEKAANPSGKKKLKLCQPVVEAPGTSRCTRPGHSNVVQPNLAYCSKDRILKHAAATMKCLSSSKEQKPKPKEKIKIKPEKFRLAQHSVQGGIKSSSLHERPAPEKKEGTVKKAVVAFSRSKSLGKETTCESSMPSWASNQNYSAVKLEKTSTVSSSLLCKPRKADGRAEEKAAVASASKRKACPGCLVGKRPSPRHLAPKKSPPFANVAAAQPSIKKAPSSFKGTISQKLWLSGTPSGGASTVRQTAASRQFPGSAALVGAIGKPVTTSLPVASPVPGHLGTWSPAQSQPSSQIRQNIRCSLKEILWKRVSDSDDLIMTEKEVGNIALHLEKEMFNLFQVTDIRYMRKYRSLLFNLKDPKNQGLFRCVLRGEISLAKLVRMKPKELGSKEISLWREKLIKSVIESRTKFCHESKKTDIKQETIPNIKDSTPVSDLGEQQESVQAVPEKSPQPLLDVRSSLLKETTSQHEAHLFNLNCKICTGHISSSEDEPPLKKQKLLASAKKEDLKSKCVSSPSDPVPNSADEGIPGTLPRNASEPDLESASHSNLERKYFPGPPGGVIPELSPVEGHRNAVVTTVTMSSWDSRTAPSGSCTVTASIAAQPDSAHVVETKQDTPMPALTSLMVPRFILANPSSSPDPGHLSVPSQNISVSESHSSPEGDTTRFLSQFNTVWKGFINMKSVAKFVTKAYPVSGCFDYLSEDLPNTIHIGGRIAPKMVWDYVGELKSSVSKELCLIRFHPLTEEEEVAYVSLYSYLSSRGRFGVVPNKTRHIKNLYLIPLGAKDPIPSALLPFEGPGKHQLSGW
ncbi:LOW QUALITY PROTEIN: death-inducer obliterator 1-like [Cynocephalus volans]|uniref:LOW QUALITY PROTEIN: death-inducer obliterator 1-like n=1 Tax=Cynocephalus volans TaxID=110931 RepID=UPI002FCA1EEE